MNQFENGKGGQADTDPGQPIDLGGVAALFNKWPGPTIMAVGTLLACAAAGIRIGGVEISGREFAGFEFGAVFFGGIVLIALGVAVLLVRERLVVADEERRIRQEHEVRMELARAQNMIETRRMETLSTAGNKAGTQFRSAYGDDAAERFLATYRTGTPNDG